MRIATMGRPGRAKGTQAPRVAARALRALRVKVEALGR
jgi:adenylate kinase family enzyme